MLLWCYQCACEPVNDNCACDKENNISGFGVARFVVKSIDGNVECTYQKIAKKR